MRRLREGSDRLCSAVRRWCNWIQGEKVVRAGRRFRDRQPRLETLETRTLLSVGQGLWLDFDADDGLGPGAATEVRITERSTQGFAGQIKLAGGWLDSVELPEGEFTQLSVPGAGDGDVVGQPRLPVVRTLLEVPEGSEVRTKVDGPPQFITLTDVGMDQPLIPNQAPVAKLPGELESAPLQRDEAVYQADRFAPPVGAKLVAAGHEQGRRTAVLEAAPIAYNPVAGVISVHDTLSFSVVFPGVKSTGVEPSTSEAAVTEEAAAPQAFPVGESAKGASATDQRLLVIVHDDFTENMAPYVTHKTGRGWIVDVADTSTAGTSNTDIQDYIQSRYDDVDTRPDAVLLVGDTDRIPHFTGFGTQNPATDLYYATMDGSNDWHPNFPVGRFSVADATQLDGVIAKTVAYESESSGVWTSRATFLASEDNYSIPEATHNYVIEHYLDPAQYTSEKLYQVTYGATTQDVRDSFNAGTALGVFSGHGSPTSWADGPRFTRADVRNLNGEGMHPFVFSFACQTGSYHLAEGFTETWLRQPDTAAVVAVGSSVNSYWTEDDILEKRLFRAIYDEGHTAVGDAWLRAKELYFEHYGVSGMTRDYFEMYNIMGDPTLEIVRSKSEAGVVGRHVFYNGSVFDDGNPDATVDDDLAVAPDKTALLPGQTATFANYTSYSRGINGVMIDLAGMPEGATPDAGDFQFLVGNDSEPSGWSVAPPPSSITMRPGAGVDGSDRITLIWPDGQISKQWLQVTTLPTENTGLFEPDVFYFGNAVGESGNSTTDAKVDAFDMLSVRNNQRDFLNLAPIDFAFDFDRDERVDVFDMLIARNHSTHFLNALELITVPESAGGGVPIEAPKGSPEEALRVLDWLREFDPAGNSSEEAVPYDPASGMVDKLLAAASS